MKHDYKSALEAIEDEREFIGKQDKQAAFIIVQRHLPAVEHALRCMVALQGDRSWLGSGETQKLADAHWDRHDHIYTNKYDAHHDGFNSGFNKGRKAMANHLMKEQG